MMNKVSTRIDMLHVNQMEVQSQSRKGGQHRQRHEQQGLSSRLRFSNISSFERELRSLSHGAGERAMRNP